MTSVHASVQPGVKVGADAILARLGFESPEHVQQTLRKIENRRRRLHAFLEQQKKGAR